MEESGFLEIKFFKEWRFQVMVGGLLFGLYISNFPYGVWNLNKAETSIGC